MTCLKGEMYLLVSYPHAGDCFADIGPRLRSSAMFIEHLCGLHPAEAVVELGTSKMLKEQGISRGKWRMALLL